MPSRFMAMLALEQPSAVSENALVAELLRQVPGWGSSVTGVTPDSEQANPDAPLMLRLGHMMVTVMWMDLPIPSSSLEPAIASAHRWPDARARLAGHRAHAIVTTITDAKNIKEAVASAAAITMVSSALATLLPCIGVYWSNGAVVTEASRFRERAQKESGGPAALDLWMQVQVVDGPPTPAGDRTHGLVSFGLEPFFGRNIEFTPSRLAPEEIAALAFGVVLQMMMEGLPRDGAVVDLGESFTMRARLSDRGWRSGQPVIELTMEGTPSGLPSGGDQPSAPQQAKPIKLMGLLALSELKPVDPWGIAAQLKTAFPAYRGLPIEYLERSGEESEPLESYRFQAGEVTVKVSLVPSQVFPTVLEAAVRAARDWPDAGRQLAGHRAQAVVELDSPAGGTTAGRVEAASLTLMFCAVLADLTPATGIYWKSGGTIIEPGRFRRRAEILASGDLPFDIMVQVNRLRNSPFISTTGLRDLLGRELEFSAVGLSDSDAVTRALAACRQLVAHGDSLCDGQPIPFEGAEVIVPKALLEGAREDIPVWSLTFKEGQADGAAAATAADGDVAPEPMRRPAIQQMPRGRPRGEKGEPGTFTALLALEQPASVGEAELIEHMRRRFPHLQSRIVSGVNDGEAREAGAPMVFSMGGCMMSVMFIDRPMPPDMMAVAARASRVWPEAEEQLAAHRAHAVVYARPNSKDWNGALDSAQNVSVVSATLADMLPTIGVYWCEGWVVSKAGVFIQATEQVLARKYSGAEWFQFWFLDAPPTDRGVPTMAVLTTGLEPFFGWELEFLPAALPPATIAHRLLGVIEYLLTSGPVLKEGDTLGVSHDEAIRVHFAPQGQRPGIPVLQLTLEQLDASISPGAATRGRRSEPAAGSAAPAGKNEAGDEGFSAILVLEQPARLNQAEFTRRLMEQYPAYRDSIESTDHHREASRLADRFMFGIGGYTVGVTSFDQPMPADSLEKMAAASLEWSNSVQDLQRHRAHVMLHVRGGTDGWKDRLECALILTAVTAVLAEMLPTIGVNWSDGATLSKAADFIKLAPKVVGGRYCDANWFRNWLTYDPDLPEAERTIAMGTIGLKRFIGREIEFRPARVDPGIMAKRLFGAVQLVLTKGPVLKHGGALKVSETERLRIHLADEGKIPGVPVYQLTLERPDGNAPSEGGGEESAAGDEKEKAAKPSFGRRVIN